eukprot:SAG31_NODE_162_length_21892_cov_343.171936_14_plen_104_part_00
MTKLANEAITLSTRGPASPVSGAMNVGVLDDPNDLANLSARLEAVKRQAVQPSPNGDSKLSPSQALASGLTDFLQRGQATERTGNLKAALNIYQYGIKTTMPR